jgi:glycine cleavage system aminomethyltransferase T
MDSRVKIEGAMTSLIVNPRPLDTATDISGSVESWLTSGEFAASSDEVFARKWNQLSDIGRKVLASLLEEGGHNVKETVVRRAVMQRFNIQSNPATEAVHKARLEFINTDLVNLSMTYTQEMSCLCILRGSFIYADKSQSGRWLEGKR